MKLLALTFGTFREAVRNKLIYTVLAFALLVVGTSALFGTITIGNTARVIKDFGLFSLSFFGMLIAVVCGVSLLTKEIKQKTIYNILSKPISRLEFVVGKFLGLALTTSCLVSLMGLGLILFVSPFDGQIDLLMFQGVFFVLLEILIVCGLVIFYSSLVVTPTLISLFTIGTYIVGRSLSYFLFFLDKSAPHYSRPVALMIRLCDRLLPDLAQLDVSKLVVYGTPVPPFQVTLALAYTGAYVVACLLLAGLIFSRRELS